MSKELNYIIKRKNKIGKKLDNDQNLLETCGEYKSSDKQWFGWCEEYETLQSIEKSLKALEIMKSAGFSLEFDESQNEWFLHISAKGTGIKTHDLLKEVLL